MSKWETRNITASDLFDLELALDKLEVEDDVIAR